MVPTLTSTQQHRLPPMLAGLAIALLAAPPQPPPTVHLAIVGPGDAVWSLYGHAAMVVGKPKQRLRKARVYNFGITDWNRPNYVQDFLTGRVEFWGATAPFAKNLARWKREDRTIELFPVQLDAGATRQTPTSTTSTTPSATTAPPACATTSTPTAAGRSTRRRARSPPPAATATTCGAPTRDGWAFSC